ncbi:hypothetical protein F5B22DRAFT_591986 [Xylaria bambusicola]|uniref:uncharacterized protein n=1 Tax=Xylaria bambusicola TaxID=326684 RepID=UPI002007D9E2|nr:uncharacterized protein F5B22DRAFT_591986 [Xylaria bambusicola]KAI0523778.1 hypothetical protein F5B22DRAFT_591986 [Xylaria bambusicola]
MSDLPENHGQGQPSPQNATASSSHGPGEPGGPSGARRNVTVNRTRSAIIDDNHSEASTSNETEGAGSSVPFQPVYGTNGNNNTDNTDTEGTETDTKDLRFPLPATRHENTPEPNIPQQLQAYLDTGAGVDGAPTPNHMGSNSDGANGDEEQAPSSTPSTPEQQDLGEQPDNAAATQGNTNNQPDVVDNNEGDENDENEEGSNSTSTSTDSPHSHRPPGPGPPPPPSQGGSAGQASGTGNRDNEPSNQTSSTSSNPSSQTTTQGQSRASGSSSHHQQAGHDALSSARTSNWGVEATTSISEDNDDNAHTHSQEVGQLERQLPVRVPLAGGVSSSPMNPMTPNIVQRQEQPAIPQEFTLPRWQPDSEVNECPICGVQFSMFYRRHHCRKCGRVVCDRCSPHRITIPHQYIVRPPGDLGPAPQRLVPGVEGSIADFGVIGGGERVRLCNPCVPDPNTTPPQPHRSSQSTVTDGRSSRTRLSSNSVSHYNAGPRPHPRHVPQNYNHGRTRSATTSTGQGPAYFAFAPYSSSSGQYPNPTYFPQHPLSQRHVSGSRLQYAPPTGHSGRDHGDWFSASGSGLNRPLPRTPTPEREVPEEDICPVCHKELPSRTLANFEILRETHINNCISSHSNYGGNRAVPTIGPGNHGTPPPRTTRRTRIFPYIATEKDCVNDAECTICLEEFQVGDEMARLECFCRFHRSCIDSWFVGHPGRCPIHQHDSFGY